MMNDFVFSGSTAVSSGAREADDEPADDDRRAQDELPRERAADHVAAPVARWTSRDASASSANRMIAIVTAREPSSVPAVAASKRRIASSSENPSPGHEKNTSTTGSVDSAIDSAAAIAPRIGHPRVPERVADQDDALLQPFRSRGAHVVGTERLVDGDVREARDLREWARREDDHRKDEVVVPSEAEARPQADAVLAHHRRRQKDQQDREKE